MIPTPDLLIRQWDAFTTPPLPGRIEASPLSDGDASSGFLFAGKRTSPEGRTYPLFLLRLPARLLAGYIPRIESKGVEIAALEDSKDPGFAFLGLSLVTEDLQGIFAVLCADIARMVQQASSDRRRYASFHDRLALWERLFEGISADGLTDIEQRGLFGEVYLIHILLDAGIPAIQVADAWTGLKGGAHDFRFGSAAVEVKTTIGNGNAIRISSEHQLDLTVAAPLFLTLFLLNPVSQGGYTLPSLIDEVRARLAGSPQALGVFDICLLQSGYIPSQRSLYESNRYHVRRTCFWRITESTPRIDPSMLPVAGVTDVAYSLKVSSLMPYSIQFAELVDTIHTAL